MDAGFCDNYRFLAKYNRWINEQLMLAGDALGDEARKFDRGAFFGSIHRTLTHLLVADQVWLRRFVDCGIAHGAAWPVQYLAGKSQLERLIVRERAALAASEGAPPRGELT